METKMSVSGDGYDPFYGAPKSISMTINEVSEDPFWDAFEHAIKMIGFFSILPEDECKYWTEFIVDQEYPSEEELDTFVSICKEGITKLIKDADKQPTPNYWSNNCEFAGLTSSIENMEGYWPYA